MERQLYDVMISDPQEEKTESYGPFSLDGARDFIISQVQEILSDSNYSRGQKALIESDLSDFLDNRGATSFVSSVRGFPTFAIRATTARAPRFTIQVYDNKTNEIVDQTGGISSFARARLLLLLQAEKDHTPLTAAARNIITEFEDDETADFLQFPDYSYEIELEETGRRAPKRKTSYEVWEIDRKTKQVTNKITGLLTFQNARQKILDSLEEFEEATTARQKAIEERAVNAFIEDPEADYFDAPGTGLSIYEIRKK